MFERQGEHEERKLKKFKANFDQQCLRQHRSCLPRRGSDDASWHRTKKLHDGTQNRHGNVHTQTGISYKKNIALHDHT